MLRLIYFFYFIGYSLSAQSNSENGSADTINLRFNEITPNTGEFKGVEMNVSYDKKNDTILLDFVVPIDMFRYKTTLSDFVILETLTNNVKLHNLNENEVAEGSIYFNYWYFKNYTFTCAIPKKNFAKLINDGLIKAVFYFAPNKNFIIERLAKEKLMAKSFVRFYEKKGSKTVRSSATEPDKANYLALSSWLSKLE